MTIRPPEPARPAATVAPPMPEPMIRTSGFRPATCCRLRVTRTSRPVVHIEEATLRGGAGNRVDDLGAVIAVAEAGADRFDRVPTGNRAEKVDCLVGQD